MICVRNIILGEGAPKICVPLTSPGVCQMLEQAKRAYELGAELLEFRADYLYNADSGKTQVQEALASLRGLLPEIPIIFTFRTKNEGGLCDIGLQEYHDIAVSAINSKNADVVDIEFFMGSGVVDTLIRAAKDSGAATIISSHNFYETPKDMADYFLSASGYGADIIKLAVTAKSPVDALLLLKEAEIFNTKHPEVLLIAISMGEHGKITRVFGGKYGSVLTFASVDSASAPGQLSIGDMLSLNEILYK